MKEDKEENKNVDKNENKNKEENENKNESMDGACFQLLKSHT